MKKYLLTAMMLMAAAIGMQAQPPSDSSPKYPQGATKQYSSGTNILAEDVECSTQYYNAVQVSGGTLTMTGCNITKTGDGSSGDNSSFYGNNSSIYAGAASSTDYGSTTAASGAKIIIQNCTVTSSSQGANAVIATNGASVEIDGITNVTATCTLSGVTVNAGSGILMYVMDDSQWSTSGATGNLILDNGEYSGTVKYDTGYTANVTVNSGAVWNLTGDATVSTLKNNGTINKNGYTLTYSSLSGSGTINEATNISEKVKVNSEKSATAYTLDGRKAIATTKGIVIKDGKKMVRQ